MSACRMPRLFRAIIVLFERRAMLLRASARRTQHSSAARVRAYAMLVPYERRYAARCCRYAAIFATPLNAADYFTPAR